MDAASLQSDASFSSNEPRMKFPDANQAKDGEVLARSERGHHEGFGVTKYEEKI